MAQQPEKAVDLSCFVLTTQKVGLIAIFGVLPTLDSPAQTTLFLSCASQQRASHLIDSKHWFLQPSNERKLETAEFLADLILTGLLL